MLINLVKIRFDDVKGRVFFIFKFCGCLQLFVYLHTEIDVNRYSHVKTIAFSK